MADCNNCAPCGTSGSTGIYVPDWGVGQTPSNDSVLTAASAFGGVRVSWTLPSTNPHLIVRTRVYRSTTNDFATANVISVTGADAYFDSNAGELIQPYYYWIEHITVFGQVMPLKGPASATAMPSISKTLQDLTGQIEEGALSQELRSRIGNIRELEDGLTQLNSVVSSETEVIATQLLGLRDSVTKTQAYVASESQIRVRDNQALAKSVDTLVAKLNTELTASLEVTKKVVADIDKGLEGLYGVKIDLAGYVSGYGLHSKVDPSGARNSTFGVNASTFSIAPPTVVQATPPANPFFGKVWGDTSQLTNGKPTIKYWNGSAWVTTPTPGLIPFIVKTEPEVVNGRTIPPGVYISQAYIDKLTADKIDTRGLDIRNTNGDIILSAGSSLNSQVAVLDAVSSRIKTDLSNAPAGIKNSEVTLGTLGAKSLATQDSVFVGSTVKFADGTTLNTGDFVNKLSKVTKDNIDAFIGNAAIGNAYIGELSAAKITTGQLSADRIDTRGLTIKDAAGNIIFGAGNNLSASLVSGLGTLATASSVSANQVIGLGTLATKNGVSTADVSGLGTLATRNSLTATEVGAVSTDLGNAPSGILNSSIQINNGVLNGIGSGAGTPVANSLISLSGLGFRGNVEATKNTVTRSTVAPSNPTDGDIWVNTNVNPNTVSVRIGDVWQVSANLTTDTSQLNDGAELGKKADWGRVTGSGKPVDNATRNTIFRSPNAPTGASVNDLWMNTATKATYYFDGFAWQLAGDVTSENTAKGIVNQGALATKSSVLIGADVRFPDGTTMRQDDFVNRLNKLSTGTISTFISDGAIGNAYIGNAAISSAKIAEAAVDTLKIAGQSVIVNVFETRVGSAEMTSISKSITISGLGPNELIPLAVGFGFTGDDSTTFRGTITKANGAVETIADDRALGRALNWMFSNTLVNNGTHTVTMTLNTAIAGLRRMSILILGTKR